MSKADKIQSVMLKIAGGAVALYYILALREAAKRKATEDYYANKQDGVGATDGEYVVKAYWTDGRYGNVRIFAGWTYDKWNGEKWAKWYNPTARLSEYEEKIYKTRKGAEKAIEELIARGENDWNGRPVEFSILTWDEYVNRYIRG